MRCWFYICFVGFHAKVSQISEPLLAGMPIWNTLLLCCTARLQLVDACHAWSVPKSCFTKDNLSNTPQRQILSWESKVPPPKLPPRPQEIRPYLFRGADAYCLGPICFVIQGTAVVLQKPLFSRSLAMETVKIDLNKLYIQEWWLVNCESRFFNFSLPVLIEVPCDRTTTTTTLFHSYFTVNILS